MEYCVLKSLVDHELRFGWDSREYVLPARGELLLPGWLAQHAVRRTECDAGGQQVRQCTAEVFHGPVDEAPRQVQETPSAPAPTLRYAGKTYPNTEALVAAIEAAFQAGGRTEASTGPESFGLGPEERAPHAGDVAVKEGRGRKARGEGREE